MPPSGFHSAEKQDNGMCYFNYISLISLTSTETSILNIFQQIFDFIMFRLQYCIQYTNNHKIYNCLILVPCYFSNNPKMLHTTVLRGSVQKPKRRRKSVKVDERRRKTADYVVILKNSSKLVNKIHT